MDNSVRKKFEFVYIEPQLSIKYRVQLALLAGQDDNGGKTKTSS